MLALLEKAWRRYPNQRLGQLIGNAARDPNRKVEVLDVDGADVFLTNYRDPFNVEDDEMWTGLAELAGGQYNPGLFDPDEDPLV